MDNSASIILDLNGHATYKIVWKDSSDPALKEEEASHLQSLFCLPGGQHKLLEAVRQRNRVHSLVRLDSEGEEKYILWQDMGDIVSEDAEDHDGGEAAWEEGLDDGNDQANDPSPQSAEEEEEDEDAPQVDTRPGPKFLNSMTLASFKSCLQSKEQQAALESWRDSTFDLGKGVTEVPVRGCFKSRLTGATYEFGENAKMKMDTRNVLKLQATELGEHKDIMSTQIFGVELDLEALPPYITIHCEGRCRWAHRKGKGKRQGGKKGGRNVSSHEGAGSVEEWEGEEEGEQQCGMDAEGLEQWQEGGLGGPEELEEGVGVGEEACHPQNSLVPVKLEGQEFTQAGWVDREYEEYAGGTMEGEEGTAEGQDVHVGAGGEEAWGMGEEVQGMQWQQQEQGQDQELSALEEVPELLERIRVLEEGKQAAQAKEKAHRKALQLLEAEQKAHKECKAQNAKTMRCFQKLMEEFKAQGAQLREYQGLASKLQRAKEEIAHKDVELGAAQGKIDELEATLAIFQGDISMEDVEQHFKQLHQGDDVEPPSKRTKASPQTPEQPRQQQRPRVVQNSGPQPQGNGTPAPRQPLAPPLFSAMEPGALGTGAGAHQQGRVEAGGLAAGRVCAVRAPTGQTRTPVGSAGALKPGPAAAGAGGGAAPAANLRRGSSTVGMAGFPGRIGIGSAQVAGRMGAPRGAAVGSRTDSRRAGSAASAPAERAANAAAPKHMPPPAAGHRPLGAGSAQRPPMGAAVAAAAMQRSQAVGATHRPGPAGTTAAAVPAAAAAAARAPQAAYMPAAPHTPHTAANPPQSPTRRSLFSHVAGQGSAAQRLGPQGLKLASVLPSSSGAAAFPQRPGPCMKPRQPAAGVDGTFLVRRPMQPSPQTPQQQHQQQHQQQQQQQQQQQGKRKAVENECANPARGFVLNPRVVPPVVPVTPEAKAARGTPAGLHSPASPPPVAQGAKKLPNPKNKARQLPSWRQPQHLAGQCPAPRPLQGSTADTGQGCRSEGYARACDHREEGTAGGCSRECSEENSSSCSGSSSDGTDVDDGSSGDAWEPNTARSDFGSRRGAVGSRRGGGGRGQRERGKGSKRRGIDEGDGEGEEEKHEEEGPGGDTEQPPKKKVRRPASVRGVMRTTLRGRGARLATGMSVRQMPTRPIVPGSGRRGMGGKQARRAGGDSCDDGEGGSDGDAAVGSNCMPSTKRGRYRWNLPAGMDKGEAGRYKMLMRRLRKHQPLGSMWTVKRVVLPNRRKATYTYTHPILGTCPGLTKAKLRTFEYVQQQQQQQQHGHLQDGQGSAPQQEQRDGGPLAQQQQELRETEQQVDLGVLIQQVELRQRQLEENEEQQQQQQQERQQQQQQQQQEQQQEQQQQGETEHEECGVEQREVQPDWPHQFGVKQAEQHEVPQYEMLQQAEQHEVPQYEMLQQPEQQEVPQAEQQLRQEEEGLQDHGQQDFDGQWKRQQQPVVQGEGHEVQEHLQGEGCMQGGGLEGHAG